MMTDRDQMIEAMANAIYWWLKGATGEPPLGHGKLAETVFDVPFGPGERIKELEAENERLLSIVKDYGDAILAAIPEWDWEERNAIRVTLGRVRFVDRLEGASE